MAQKWIHPPTYCVNCRRLVICGFRKRLLEWGEQDKCMNYAPAEPQTKKHTI